MKRRTLFSLLMCLILLFSLTLPVLAEAENPSDSSVQSPKEEEPPEDSDQPQDPPAPPKQTDPPGTPPDPSDESKPTKPSPADSDNPPENNDSTEGNKPTDSAEDTTPTDPAKDNESANPDGHTHLYDSSCDPTCNVCGKSRTVSHVPGTEWYKNAEGHWHVCTLCGMRLRKTSHRADPAATKTADQVCQTCGYVLTGNLNHVHSFQTEFTSNETGHWYACDDCDGRKDFSEHTYDDPCDSDCNVCGFIRDDAHSYGEQLIHDEKCHWGVCTLCGAEGEHQNHVPGEPENTPQVCTVCGMELAPALGHVHAGEDWERDQQTHHRVCACGFVMDEGPHTWDEGSAHSDGTVTYTCTQCGAHRLEGMSKGAGMDPTMKIVGGAALLCAVSAAVALAILFGKSRYSM